MRTIRFILQKEFLQIFRNKTMIPIIFFVPIVQLLVLSYTATFEIRNVNLVVVDLDQSTESRELKGKFQGSPFFTISDQTFSYALAEEMLKKNKADQILHIPAGFSQDMEREKRAKVQLTTNAINGSAASLMSAYAQSIILDYNRNIVVGSIGLSGNPEPIRINYSFWYNPELNYITYMVPGILVLLVTIIGMFLSSMNLVREKEIGTIEQINVTPIKKYQLIIGKLLPFWLIALFELAFGLAIAKLVFNIPILGSIGLIFLVAMIYLLVIQGFGLLISTLTFTQQQAMFLSWFFLVIFIMMSGLFTPVQSMPLWAQYINYANPIAYFIEIIRMIMLKGSMMADIQKPLMALGIYAVISLSLATWRYRKVA